MEWLDIATFAVSTLLMLIGLATVACLGALFIGGYWE